MPLIVVMEDDAGTRLLVTQVLKKQGFEVHAAENGAKGLDLIKLYKPDVVVSDVQMPEMDGFAVLDIVRNSPEIATTPFIMLTSLHERAHVRQGMRTGADDYLTKPFAPQELRDAVTAQINKLVRQESVRADLVDQAVDQALKEQKNAIADLYEKRLARSLSEQWPDSGWVAEDDKYASATVLYADIRDYALWTQRLSGQELGDVVKTFYGNMGDTVHLFGARYMQFVGDGMLCVFVDDSDTQSVNHSLRAARAAVGLGDTMRRVDAHVRERFSDRNLPPFALSVALHSGPVAFARLQGGFGGGAQLTPVGDTVATALNLFKSPAAADWTIAASVQTARLVGGAVRFGRRAMLPSPGRATPLDAVEVLGLA